MTRVTRKQTVRSFSLSYQKKATPILRLVWHQLFRIWLCWNHKLYSWKVGVIPKERWARPRNKDLKVYFLVTPVICDYFPGIKKKIKIKIAWKKTTGNYYWIIIPTFIFSRWIGRLILSLMLSYQRMFRNMTRDSWALAGTKSHMY